MFTALTSLLTGRKVRADTAMTGECSLRGRVLPVGGAGAIVALLALRFYQRREVRYQLTTDQVLIGEHGRYVIAFPRVGNPAVTLDRFGAELVQVAAVAVAAIEAIDRKAAGRQGVKR